MLSKLFSSDEKIAKALQVHTTGYDLSPSLIVVEEEEPKPRIPTNNNARMWIEDWSEEDEARLRDPDVTFGITWSNKIR
jgi:hypothetical protein